MDTDADVHGASTADPDLIQQLQSQMEKLRVETEEHKKQWLAEQRQINEQRFQEMCTKYEAEMSARVAAERRELLRMAEALRAQAVSADLLACLFCF